MNLIEKARQRRADEAAKATASSGRSPEIKAEVAKLEAEERAALTPPDAPAPSKVAEIPADAPAQAGQCANSGNTRELDIDQVASKSYACSCGQTFKRLKPQKLGDGKYYAMVPKHDLQPAQPPPAQPPPVPTVEAASAPATPEPKPASAPALPPPAGLVLYLDAGEDGVHAERLERYAEQLCRDLEQQCGAADVRCAPGDSALGFGKWKGALAAYARTSPPKPGAYEVSASSDVGFVVFEALVPLASRVVRKRG
jgi:hypothetical protein